MKPGLSILALVTGAALMLGAAALSGAAPRGGTLRIDVGGTVRFVDPTHSITFMLMHPTHLQLVGYPDEEAPEGTRVVPEASPFPSVSRDGRTYTFRIRKGFRFSNGEPVTAASFALSINRALNPAMQAYAELYVRDIVGAQDVKEGKSQTAHGVRVRGNTLTITLKRAAPDFLSRIALPHFAALPRDFPIEPEGVSQAPIHSAGPYYLREYVPGRSAVLVRNPFWRRDLLSRRPANVDRVEVTYGINPIESVARVEKGDADLAPVPGSLASEIHAKYGLNRSRFFVRPQPRLWYLGFNTERPLFKNNSALRRAINFAIDRPHLTRQLGFLAGRRTDQLLTPTMAGFRDVKLYPIAGADVPRARALARDNLRDGKVVFYAPGTPTGSAIAGIVAYNLRQIGLEVEVRLFATSILEERLQRPDEPYDLSFGDWFIDYPDPTNVFEHMLHETAPRFHDAAFDGRIRRASRLQGEKRLAAFAKLDADLMREQAPIAPIVIPNSRALVSARTGCYRYQPVLGTPDVAALCKR